MYKSRQTQCHKEQRFPYVSYNAFITMNTLTVKTTVGIVLIIKM